MLKYTITTYLRHAIRAAHAVVDVVVDVVGLGSPQVTDKSVAIARTETYILTRVASEVSTDNVACSQQACLLYFSPWPAQE